MSIPKPSERSPLATIIAWCVGAVVVVSLIALLVISLGSDNISSHVSKAQSARDSADLAAEKAALEALKEADPLRIESLVGLARIARTEGRLMDAAKQWGEIVALDPLNEQARFEQIRNLYAVGDYRSVLSLAAHSSLAKNADVQALHAATLMASGRPEEADALIEASLKNIPEHPQTKLLYADRLFIKGQLERAKAVYRSLQDNPAVSDSAYFALAQIHFSQGEKAQAAALLRQHPPAADAAFQVLKARAELWRQMGGLDEAIGSYQQMLPLYGPIPEVIVPLAELTSYRGDARAIATLREQLAVGSSSALAAHHYLEALEAYLLKQPEDVLARLGWSEAYYGKRDVFRWAELDASLRVADVVRAQAAVTALSQMNLTALRRLHAADLVAARAADWADRSDFDSAESLAELAFELAPKHPAARLVIARVALVDGRETLAAALANDLLSENELRPAALEILGRVSTDKGDFAAGEAYLRQMVELMPETSTAHYWLGVNLFRQQQYERAMASLQMAQRYNPNDPRIAGALLDALMKAQLWPQAMALSEQQIAADDASARAIGWAFKAGVHRAQGELQPAVVAYRKAMAEDPRRSAYGLAASDLLVDQQQFAQAEAILSDLAQRYPDNRVVRFKQGYVAQLQGNDEAAIGYYRQLLEDDPNWALVLLNLSELLGADSETRAEALAMAGDAATLSPDWDRAHWNLAQRAYESGDRKLAQRAAQRVLVLSPADAEAQAMLAQLGEQR